MEFTSLFPATSHPDSVPEDTFMADRTLQPSHTDDHLLSPIGTTTMSAHHDDAHPVLTPPTSEDMEKKDGVNNHDLEEEDDDDWDIEPDHYYDGGKIPIFKPTMRQFRDFEKFIDKVNKYGMKSGIVKVIPPKEWREMQPNLSEKVKEIRVKNPITQEFAGTHGTYTQANIEKQRSYNLPQWKSLTEESNHQPPARRGERRRQPEAAPKAASKPKVARNASISSASTANAAAGVKRPRGRPRKNPLPAEPTPAPSETTHSEQENVPPTPTSPITKEEEPEDTIEVKDEPIESTEVTPVKRGRGRPPKSQTQVKSTPTPRSRRTKGEPKVKGETKTTVASRRMNNKQDVVAIDETAFKGFDYHMDNLEQFTPERCKELEEVYWKTINYGTPMYGADMPGSLFDDQTPCWNVAKLPNVLDCLGTQVPGVNTAYLYLGMWKATFAWHLEDVDLYSINYIHFGAPKYWYSISQEDARRFEAAMKTIWPNDAKHCDQFLRHKTYLISPEKLKSQFNITVNRLVHYEGEFVITYPYGYHSGFNIGYNCAESVNFANESWLDFGRIAKKCECESDSVWVDVYEIERKLRGEPTPEYYEVTDDEDDDGMDHLPSPAPSEKNKRGRKRKRDDKGKEPVRKTKKIKIRVKAPSAEPCVLCPNDVPYDMLLPTDNGKKAHRMCALYTPETFLVTHNGVEKVCNVAGINKARLELRCMYCRSKKGTCFQCSSKKCHRAYHATCAAAAGVQIDAGVVPTWDEDGVEYYCEGYDFRCKYHRPKRPKHTDSESLEKNQFILGYGASLVAGNVIQAQTIDGDLFAGQVLMNLLGERSCVVEVLPDGEHIEVEWKYLLVLDPADSLRPKPSPDAKPLPAHLLQKPAEFSSSNRKDGVPSEGDPFTDPFSKERWQEFHAATWHEIRNSVQEKVNLDKPEQLWFYIGKPSTEAKPHYTHDVRVVKNNPRSNFMESVRPAPVPFIARQVQAPSPGFGYPQHSHTIPSPYQAPRSDKPYVYKPKNPAAPQYGQRLPWQPIQPAVTRTIAPQQMHYGYPSTSQSGSGYASSSQQQPMYGPSTWGQPKPPQSMSTYAGPPLTSPYHNSSNSHDHSKKPVVTPIDTAAAATTKPSRLDNSPPHANFYAQAEERYSSQRAQEYSKRYQELTNTAHSSGTTAIAGAPIASLLNTSASPVAPIIKMEQSPVESLALASLRSMPSGSLPHSPSLTHMPFTPPSKRPDISSLINNEPSVKPEISARPKTSHGLSKLLHGGSHKVSKSLDISRPKDFSTTPLDSPHMSALLNHAPLTHPSSAAHSHHLAYDAIDPALSRRYSPQPMYQTADQFSQHLHSAPLGPKLNRFDEYIRQLNPSHGVNNVQTGVGGNVFAGPPTSNGLPPLPAMSAEAMDIFRDSVVFTPPPEAQRAHQMRLASQLPAGPGAGFDQSPERPTYSPLSQNGDL
ncbi:hypothetical protein BT63DRAFT_452799 [Microthyrium microscopicum]|uniref:[histone H3]-trimethyl-L-lysine(9) demethylase n=1 Tax=Microthyrium microscopicum TaxID=703497 RepID=A0A6A6UJ43_9PEZI|nr:hypothetical protein BT63DRAFT_452799 [Microthyrium microscopicum]